MFPAQEGESRSVPAPGAFGSRLSGVISHLGQCLSASEERTDRQTHTPHSGGGIQKLSGSEDLSCRTSEVFWVSQAWRWKCQAEALQRSAGGSRCDNTLKRHLPSSQTLLKAGPSCRHLLPSSGSTQTLGTSSGSWYQRQAVGSRKEPCCSARPGGSSRE